MIHLILKNFPPNVPPKLVGQHWVDKAGRRMWFSIGALYVSDWMEMGTVATASLLDSPLVVRSNMASARAVDPTPLIKPAILVTEGGETAGDGYSKTFRWVENSMAVDDGSAYSVNVKPNVLDASDPGRWEQTTLG